MKNENSPIPQLSEEELLLEIDRITSKRNAFEQTVERIGELLEREAYGKAFLVEFPGSGSKESILSTSEEIQDFLGSIQMPYRSLYSVPLESGGQERGKLVACFASPRFLGDLPRRVAAHAAQELSHLLAA